MIRRIEFRQLVGVAGLWLLLQLNRWDLELLWRDLDGMTGLFFAFVLLALIPRRIFPLGLILMSAYFVVMGIRLLEFRKVQPTAVGFFLVAAIFLLTAVVAFKQLRSGYATNLDRGQ